MMNTLSVEHEIKVTSFSKGLPRNLRDRAHDVSAQILFKITPLFDVANDLREIARPLRCQRILLEGALRERIRTIIRQVCKELGVQIVSGVLSREHVHMFVEIPPHIAVSDFVRRVKGRSSHRVQMEFPDLRKRYWGRHFWARGYFSTTSGNITDDVILQYLQEHEPTGVSR